MSEHVSTEFQVKLAKDAKQFTMYSGPGAMLVEESVEVLRANEPPDGYYLAFSGGKDSQVLWAVAELAGVKFQAYYHPSPLDAPEQIRFIRDHYPATMFERPVMPFWHAFAKKGFPLRRKRWCCEYIKEWGGSGRVMLLGLRAEESRGRAGRHFVADTSLSKTRFGPAPRLQVLPLLHWTERDVWVFLNERHIPHCSLYDEGIKRLGCIMCPLASPEKRLKEYYRFPKTAMAWYWAFERLYEAKRDIYSKRWPSADALFWWWMAQDDPAAPKREEPVELLRGIG